MKSARETTDVKPQALEQSNNKVINPRRPQEADFHSSPYPKKYMFRSF